MKNILLIFVAVLPIYLLGLYVYKHDKEKESRKLLSKLFIFGIISCIPTIVLELLAGMIFPPEESMNLITLFLYVLIGIALIEEFWKWFMTYKVAYNHIEFDHIYDALVYSVFVTLGFAAIENILYVIDSGFLVGLLRGVIAVPGHVCYAIIMGNYLGIAKASNINGNKKEEKKNLILSIIIPTLAHTLYDYCLFTEIIFFLIIFVIVVIAIYIYSIKKIKRLSKIENNLQEKISNYCPKCGNKSKGKYCTNCGTNLTKK